MYRHVHKYTHAQTRTYVHTDRQTIIILYLHLLSFLIGSNDATQLITVLVRYISSLNLQYYITRVYPCQECGRTLRHRVYNSIRCVSTAHRDATICLSREHHHMKITRQNIPTSSRKPNFCTLASRYTRRLLFSGGALMEISTEGLQ